MAYEQLNAAQQAVVDAKSGPVLVIAGPGSGKTKTMVERTVSLIDSGVKPQRIMVATFTEKAAKELLTRISNLLIANNSSVNPNDLYIGTLHSIFLKLIEENQEFTRVKRNYRLLDPFEQTFVIYANLRRFHDEVTDIDFITNPNGRDYVGRWQQAQAIVKKVNIVSEEALDLGRLLAASDPEVRCLANCYMVYQDILQEQNALDFSTIQSEMLHLIKENPEVLRAIQDKIEYFMIDEYQDTNTIQERILLLLASKNNNICVVGDDDQGLYRFRGATIRNILRFADNFPKGDCKTIYLQTNYRSHKEIIRFCNEFMQSKDWKIGGNSFRYNKSIVPADRSYNQVKTVLKVTQPVSPVACANNDSEEVPETPYRREVLDFIRMLETNGIITNYNQITFLYRSVKSDEATNLMRYLEQNGIPVFSPRSDQFFQRPEIISIIGALLIIFPQTLSEKDVIPDDRLRQDFQHIQDSFFEYLNADPVANRDLISWLITYSAKHRNLTENTDYAFSQLIYQLFRYPFFAKWLDTDMSSPKADLRPAYNIGLFLQLISKYEYLYNISVISKEHIKYVLSTLFNQFLRFNMDGGLDEFEDFDETIPSGAISFMTIHQAKGLEFPVTVVGSMNAIPRRSYDALEGLLQECYYNRPLYEPLEEVKNFDFYRLFYTAFSRAKNLLILTGEEKQGHGACPSKYLTGAWEQAVNWRRLQSSDWALIQQSDVQPTNVKHEYSFTSHILLYENCPLMYKFFKEFGFTEVRTGGTIGGTLLHETIEDIHRAVLRGEQNNLPDSSIIAWFNQNYQDLIKKEHGFIQEAQRNAILKQVLRYRDANQNSWDTIKDAEVDVSLVRPDYILKGKIDLVEGEDGKLDIVDFKSGNKPDINTQDPLVQRILNQYRRQLEVYAFIIEQRTGKKIGKMHLYYPKEESGNPRLSFSYVPDFVHNTISTFEEVVHQIEAHHFSMDNHTCNERQCRECELRHYCHKM